MNEHPWTGIVAMNGFIYVGRTHREGDRLVIEDCYNVRRFSLETKDGLGGLFLRVPKKDNDVLDACPTVRVFVFAIVNDFEVPDQDAWSKWHASQAKKKGAK